MKVKTLDSIKAFFLIFLLVFNIKIRFIPVFTSNILLGLLGAALAVVLLSHNFRNIFISKRLYLHLLFFTFLLFYANATLMVNLSTDLSLIKLLVINNTISILAANFVAFYLYKKNIPLRRFFKIFVYVYFIQMIIVAVFFFNRDICRTAYTIIDMGDRINGKLEDLIAYRAFGISFGFDMGTADLTVAMIFCVYLYLTEENHYKHWLIIYVFCCAMGILVARTMFLGIGVSGLFYIFFPNAKGKRKREALFSLFLLIAIVVVIFFLFFDVEKYMRTIWWVTDIFVQMFSSKGLNHGSLYELTKGDFVFVPETRTLIFGEGKFADNLVSRYTDVGYIRLLMYFGILGFIIYFLYIFSRTTLFFREKKDTQLKYMSFFLFLFQFIFFWKIYYPITSYPLLMLYGLMPYLNSKIRIRNNSNVTSVY